MRISFKYDFHGLRADVLEHISRIYPSTLDAFEAISDNHSLRSCSRAATMLNFVIEARVDDLFPALYYACARLRLPQIRERLPDTRAVWATLYRIHDGQEKLNGDVRLIMSIFMEVSEKCVVLHLSKDSPYHRVAWDRDFATVFGTRNLQSLSGEMLLRSFPNRTCDSCRTTIAQNINIERKKV